MKDPQLRNNGNHTMTEENETSDEQYDFSTEIDQSHDYSFDADSADEHYRIHVPQPDTELVLGKGTNKFVGIMGRVDKGGVFFGAGGFPGGLPSFDSTYAGFKRAHTTISIAISGLAAAALFARSIYMKREMCIFDAVVNGATFVVPTAIGAGFAIADNGTSDAAGNVSLYGDKTIQLASPMTISATAGLAASVNAGIAVSLNAIGAASINGLVTGVYGTLFANVAAIKSTLIGDAAVCVASRDGTTAIEGKRVEIGKPSLPGKPGKAYEGIGAAILTGGQAATTRIDLKADDTILLEPGQMVDKLQGPPVRIEATKEAIRAETLDAALVLSDSATLHAGKSVISLKSDGMKLFAAASSVKDATNAARAAAERTWSAAYKTADAAHEAVDSGVFMVLSPLLGAAGAGIVAGAAASPLDNDAAETGIGLGAAAAGGVLGPLATLGITKIVEKVLTKKACDAAKKAADEAYKTALEAVAETESSLVDAQAALATNPIVDVSSSGIKLTFGKSSIEITATGIKIETAPGGTLTLNGHTFKNGGMPVLTVD